MMKAANSNGLGAAAGSAGSAGADNRHSGPPATRSSATASRADEGAGISRREAIRRAALLFGVAVAPSWLAAIDRVKAAPPQAYLAATQLALVTAVADRILPRTDTPGASDVGVPAFLDVLYGEFMSREEQARFTQGLDAIAAASTREHRSPFASLTVDQQDAILRRIAEAEQDLDDSPFRQIRSAVVLGYFTSEEVGRTVLHYDPVPGRYDACIPIDEVGNRNWTT